MKGNKDLLIWANKKAEEEEKSSARFLLDIIQRSTLAA